MKRMQAIISGVLLFTIVFPLMSMYSPALELAMQEEANLEWNIDDIIEQEYVDTTEPVLLESVEFEEPVQNEPIHEELAFTQDQEIEEPVQYTDPEYAPVSAREPMHEPLHHPQRSEPRYSTKALTSYQARQHHSVAELPAFGAPEKKQEPEVQASDVVTQGVELPPVASFAVPAPEDRVTPPSEHVYAMEQKEIPNGNLPVSMPTYPCKNAGNMPTDLTLSEQLDWLIYDGCKESLDRAQELLDVFGRKKYIRAIVRKFQERINAARDVINSTVAQR